MTGTRPGRPSAGASTFDADLYVRTVLAPLAGVGSLPDDPFLLVGLDPDVTDTAEVVTHLNEVRRLWVKRQSHPKHKPVLIALLQRYDELADELLDPHRRAQARSRVLSEREAKHAASMARLRKLIEALGTEPVLQQRLLWLRELVRSHGLGESDAEALLAGVVVTEAGRPLDRAVAAQIRDQLAQIGLLRGDDRLSAHLFAFLGLPFTAGRRRVSAAYDMALAASTGRAYDRDKSVSAELLARVKELLLTDMVRAYRDAVLAHAGEQMRASVLEHVIWDGRLSSAAVRALVRDGVARLGLPPAEVEGVVVAVAAELGVPVHVAQVEDVLVCPACRTGQGQADGCRLCGAALHRACPSCGAQMPAALLDCPHCHASFSAELEARPLLERGQQLLEQGRPAASMDVLKQAAARAPHLPGLVLAVDAARIQITGGQDLWRQLEGQVAARRLFAAVETAQVLLSDAVDVLGPRGVSAQDRMGMLRARTAAVLDQLVQAGDDVEAILTVLEAAVDCPQALRALAAQPLPTPADVRLSELDDRRLLLAWERPAAAGPVLFEVTRHLTAAPQTPGGQRPQSQVTRHSGVATSPFIDARPPVGSVVQYAVAVCRGGLTGSPVLSAQHLVVGEVRDVRAESRPDHVLIRWTSELPSPSTVIERTALSSDQSDVRRFELEGPLLLEDTDPVPDGQYRYVVRQRLTALDGSEVLSEGITVTLTHSGAPVMVDDLAVSAPAGGVLLDLTAPAYGEVKVYAMHKALATAGRCVSLSDAQEQGLLRGRVALRVRTGKHAVSGQRVMEFDRKAPTQPTVYTPVHFTGDRVMFGKSVRFVP